MTRDDNKPTPKAADSGAPDVKASHSVFTINDSRNLSEQEKITIAEGVVRRFGFQSLDEFNKYDKAVPAAKQRRMSPDDNS